MKEICKLRINREGSFSVTPAEGAETQCGTVGKRDYTYFVSIEATNRRLTPEGYVMENGLTDEYFQKTYNGKTMVCPSCEQMAQDAIEYFRSKFDYEGAPELTRIYVRINGTPFSFIEGEWNAKKV